MYTKADVAISATSGLYKLNFGKSRLDLSLVTVSMISLLLVRKYFTCIEDRYVHIKHD